MMAIAWLFGYSGIDWSGWVVWLLTLLNGQAKAAAEAESMTSLRPR
jgi:hypothetical protein